MPVVPHLKSIAAIAAQTRTAQDFYLGFRDFLDGFYADPQAAKLLEEPRRVADILHDHGYADAYLAALASISLGNTAFPSRPGVAIPSGA